VSCTKLSEVESCEESVPQPNSARIRNPVNVCLNSIKSLLTTNLTSLKISSYEDVNIGVMTLKIYTYLELKNLSLT
jgi:hypothetical protein